MGEMDKAESECANRFMSKFIEMHELIGKEITEFSMKVSLKWKLPKIKDLITCSGPSGPSSVHHEEYNLKKMFP